MYAKNYKTQMKNYDLNKWIDTLYSLFGMLSIVKMSLLYKLIYRFNPIPVK